MTNTKKLKSLLTLKGITLSKLSKHVGISVTSLSYKLNNKVEFKVSEIAKIQKYLELTDSERNDIFFKMNVD